MSSSFEKAHEYETVPDIFAGDVMRGPITPVKRVGPPNNYSRFHDGKTPQIELDYESNRQAALASRARAIAADEAYPIPSIASENRITMMRAVDVYGDQVAEQRKFFPQKVTEAALQLREFDGASNGQDAVDAAAYIITARSLEHMAKHAADNQERTAAGWALESMAGASETIKRLGQEDVLGPHSGELAVQAIMEYQPDPAHR